MKIKISKSQWEEMGKKAKWEGQYPTPMRSVQADPQKILSFKELAKKNGWEVRDTPNGFEVIVPVEPTRA